ncbi:hypothetical protein AGABI2DRAFT_186399 [Agaricus bisporus var. bisporus H97]|uniref:hypothetical protein n=1 Tax=Agaricus bisporus var. bisporus (strain H97 / ATCC MYA-4626 / FGSC 10389) TaxID=936046 RepID=UPI00029F6DB8|nr:hypothetical protein AGABI2DRAFT_186399 [Agaricus bisporus var. bisporus H97]EKV45678.1 hypothetical protein AGABI2DRAFT_186399 [Agaricus bisporus var. bisporus H97]
MAHLSKSTQYDIEDSNIALLGSDLEKRVRENAGDIEPAWEQAGCTPGLQIWRIEQFRVVEWPKDHYGTFYSGDSYIVLYTYKSSPDASSFSFDLHFWLGRKTTQDEAGTAAYKTVELDDHLHGIPLQYREIQNNESSRFLSHFSQFICLDGGVSTGFHHVTQPPELDFQKLYCINLARASTTGKSNLVVREVPAEASSLIQGDVYVLDKGSRILQLNTRNSVGQERFKAAEFVRNLVDNRKHKCEVVVYDEGGPQASLFLRELNAESVIPSQVQDGGQTILMRLSDATGPGAISFTPVTNLGRSSLLSEDAFLLDSSQDPTQPAIYVWLGKRASLNERRLSIQYAQSYLHQQRSTRVTVPIIKLEEGHETEEFIQSLSSQT